MAVTAPKTNSSLIRAWEKEKNPIIERKNLVPKALPLEIGKSPRKEVVRGSQMNQYEMHWSFRLQMVTADKRKNLTLLSGLHCLFFLKVFRRDVVAFILDEINKDF